MRMIILIHPGTDNSKAGTLPYDLVAFPFHSQEFNPKILSPKSQKLFHSYFKVTRPSFFGRVPSYLAALWFPHLYFYRKSNK